MGTGHVRVIFYHAIGASGWCGTCAAVALVWYTIHNAFDYAHWIGTARDWSIDARTPEPYSHQDSLGLWPGGRHACNWRSTCVERSCAAGFSLFERALVYRH